MGIRTSDPVEVIYRELTPDEEEAPIISELLRELINRNPFYMDKYDHSIVVHYDPPSSSNPRKEVMIPVYGPVQGLNTKTFPSVKSAFLVFKDTDTTQEEYYELLCRYIREEGLQPSKEIYSIEIMYVPEDLDAQDFTIELMIPLVK
jgi:hypothetical protein